MDFYEGDDAVETVVQKLEECETLSGHNQELLREFRDWLLENRRGDAPVILFAWYVLRDQVTFELDAVPRERAERMLENAPEQHTDLCERAITVFYDSFLPERRAE